MGYFFNRFLFGRKAASDILTFEGLVYVVCIFVGFGILLGAGLFYICFWLWKEITLELQYQHQYGVAWKVEYERYHGSLSHVHLQMVVGVIGLLALLIVLGWIGRTLLHKLRHRRHHGAV